MNVTNNMLPADLSASDRIELSISPAAANPIWASIINATRFAADGTTVTTQGEFYQRVYRGVEGGGTVTWSEVGPGGQPPDVLTGNQGDLHGSIVADPNSDNLVYIGGDRINTGDAATAGYIARGDSTANTWTGITPVGSASGDAGTAVPTANPADVTAPHADTRSMTFAAGGVLLLCCDGGMYQCTSPSSGNQVWTSISWHDARHRILYGLLRQPVPHHLRRSAGQRDALPERPERCQQLQRSKRGRRRGHGRR